MFKGQLLELAKKNICKYAPKLLEIYKKITGEHSHLNAELNHKNGVKLESDEERDDLVTTAYSSKDNIVYVFEFDGEEMSDEFFLKIREEKPKGVRIFIVRPDQKSEEYIFKDEN